MNKTILIIDDDLLVRLIVEKMMSKIDPTLTFIPCEDGKVGLERLIEHQGNRSEYIIILDLNMPVLDGWGFLDKIQSQHLNKNNIEIFILSSSTDKSDIERAKRYPLVKKFYHKPLTNYDIIEILKLENLKR